MNGLFFWLCALILLITGFACVADQRVIEFIDGSQIRGEIVSFGSGVYSIRSEVLGQIKVKEGQVKAIYSAGRPQPNVDVSIESVRSSILGSSSLMGSILNLQDNPDVQAVLSDPEVMSAIQRMDLEMLRNHPKIKRLMNNSRIKEIQSDLN